MSIRDELREIIISYLKEKREIFPSIIGQEESKKQIIASLISGRNILIVGPPGVGKTTLAKDIANLLPPIKFPENIPKWAYKEFPFTPKKYIKKWEEGPFIELKGKDRFIRIQGSYDLTIEDLIGDIDPSRAMKYGISIKSFIPGKIFRAHKGVLFFDEINRAPPKVQNTLLQLLEEKRVTIGYYEFEIPVDIIFIATMNPEDYYGVEKMSDVLLDRFDVVFLNYPKNVEEEKEIVYRYGKKLVEFDEKLLDLLIEFIQNLRKDDRLEKKPSVRSTIGLYEKAQGFAIIDGEKEVKLNHIFQSLISILSHRIRLKPSYRLEMNEEEFIKKEWDKFLIGRNYYRS